MFPGGQTPGVGVARDLERRRPEVLVRLTAQGFDLVEEVVVAHMATEREILAALSPRQQDELAHLLRTTLLALGDRADAHEGPQ